MRSALILLLLALASPALADQPVEYVGQLRGEPIPDTSGGNILFLDPAPPELLAALPWPPAAGDQISAGSFRALRRHRQAVKVVLVEPSGGEPYVYADTDLDGSLRAWERYAFGKVPGVEEGLAVLLKVPPGNAGLVPFYPVLLRPYPEPVLDNSKRRLVQSSAAYLQGKAQIGFLEVLVRYPISPRTGEVMLDGWIGMDLDDDGIIEPGLSSGEVDRDVGDGAPVFRLGSTYLSTSSVDPVTGRVVLRTRPASDYKRFDLRPGAELADFAFTDPEGRQRRLSELRGKVVLLDFWGTWCGWCMLELPTLRKAHESYRDRGFVILGMNYEDDLETLKQFLAKEEGTPWVHATAESVRDLIEKSFRVWSYPTHILLDREGRIVSAGQPGQPSLKDEDFLKTIEEVVMRKPVAEYAGRLDGEAVPRSGAGLPQKLEPASPEILAALPVRPAPDERVYAGKMRLLRRTELDAQLVLVEPPQGQPFLYADVDLDGRLSAGERFEFGEPLLLRFPMATGHLRSYPILLRYEKATLYRSGGGFLEGTVPVAGREVKVRYPLSMEAADVNLQAGELGMDLDGDGEIEAPLAAGETQWASGETEPAIFRLGDLYLSTKSVDPAAGRVVLRTHAASEYKRFELHPGSQVPDFELTDLDGRQRRLSELRGKVVLLDFWGVWCSACVEELPGLRKAYEAYRDRGFEIVGMDFGDKPEEHRKFVAEMGLPWVHATAASVETVIQKSFGVWRFPTKILLDREGRVLAVEEGDPTGDEGLMKTLAEVFSEKTSVPAR